jgi:hypothetical protein
VISLVSIPAGNHFHHRPDRSVACSTFNYPELARPMIYIPIMQQDHLGAGIL